MQIEMDYKGTSMKDMYKGHGPWNFEIPSIHPSKYHSVLYEVPPNLVEPPNPHISVNTFHWNDGYVRMPYSKDNLYPSKDENGRDVLISRWKLICETYQRPIRNSRSLENAIYAYNNRLPKFSGLTYFLDEVLEEEESEHFYRNILPDIIKLALKLPDILPGSIPLLKADTCKSISLSQLQIASLLANAFLCTLPWRKDMAATYPSINFYSLFSARIADTDDYIAEKYKCLIHYFRKVCEKAPVGVVTFERQHIRKSNNPRWDKIDNNLGNTRLHVTSTGTIEDDGLGLLQIDFANKFLGGGVLSYGCVQEEIRFLICPELLISRLFTEKLNSSEALIITGVERFSKYSGYSDTFLWSGSFKDETPFDESGRRQTTIVAIDATPFHKATDQFSSSLILRELNKAHAGFYSRFPGGLSPIATGNWGCGAFKGDAHLKFLIQLMASSAARRDIVYYTFGDEDLRDNIYDMYSFIATNKITICNLWRLICKFISAQLSPNKFFPYIQQAYFDSKSQPSIKNFFPKKPDESTPSTSSMPQNEAIVIDDTMDVAIDIEQRKAPSPVISKRKCVKSEPVDLISIMNKIDGVEKPHLNTNDNFGVTFLECIDDYSKRQSNNGKIESECINVEEQMDVDEILENVAESSVKSKARVLGKRKISDYFAKIN